MNKILVYGYGNPGRQDDGLGIFLIEKIEKWKQQHNIENVFTDSNYQLNIEDAYNLNSYHTVIFADASKEDIESYRFTTLESSFKPEFTMHAVSPAFVLGICKNMYGTCPGAFLLHIKGYQWEFMQQPTSRAQNNLEEAYSFLVQKIIKLIG
ncbi:MAG: hydrogenase maturation protease [Bacteroidales bacterium]|nr:hydrogenase maturation protease [Bacteroidales bacterium]